MERDHCMATVPPDIYIWYSCDPDEGLVVAMSITEWGLVPLVFTSLEIAESVEQTVVAWAKEDSMEYRLYRHGGTGWVLLKKIHSELSACR
jgi:hypothetical protein